MKKSNKLLVAGFLAVVLFITAIHITLYAKYKAGNYTIYNAEDDLAPQTMQSFPNIVFVTVRDVPVANVQFSDVARVEKDEESGIQYTQKGDTLLITGSSGNQGFHEGATFHLPYNANLSVFNSSLYFRANKRAGNNSPVINLKKSRVSFYGAKDPFQFGHVKLLATDSSIASFAGNTQIDHLEVQLSSSTLEYGEGNFGQMSIATDSLSRLSLQSKHLLKANIKTIAPQ